MAAAGLVATSAFAQKRAFEGFYGQIAAGYENNQASSLGATPTESGRPTDNWNASIQSFGGVPLVIGVCYNFSVAPKWIIGLGVDFTAISQKSSTFSYNTGAASLNGVTMEASNRFNVFVATGYEVDKDKLVYLKAGYSSVTAKSNSPTSYAFGGYSGSLSSVSQSKTLSGYVLGLGYKQVIGGGLYCLVEFNYMSYSKARFSGTDSIVYTTTANPSVSAYQAPLMLVISSNLVLLSLFSQAALWSGFFIY